MFQNISTVNCLIYAVCIGFIFAIIYTNIQRSALSKFIEHLINEDIDNNEKAVTLSQIGLKGLSFFIVKSNIKNQYGLKNVINIINGDEGEDLSPISVKEKNNRYYLSSECDKEMLLKKYGYKKMSLRFVIIFIIALIITAIIASFLTDKMINGVSISNRSEEQNAHQETNQNDIYCNDSDSEDDNGKQEDSIEDSLQDITDNTKDDDVSTPRLPIGGSNQ